MSTTINIHLEVGPLCLVPVPQLRSLRGRFEFGSRSLFVMATSNTSESVFVGWWHAGEFERGTEFGGWLSAERRRGTPGAEKRGCERIDPKIPNRKLQCRLPVGMWILSSRFLMENGFFIFIFFFFNLARADCRVFFGIELGTNRRWWWRKFLIRGSRESPWREINLLTLDDYKKWWYRERENSKYVRVKEKEKKRRKKIWRKQESVTKDESELLLV